MADDKVTIDPGFRPSHRGQDGGDGRGLRWAAIAATAVATLLVGWLLRSPAPGPPEPAASDALGVTTMEGSSVATPPATSGPRRGASSVPLARADVDVPLGEAVPGFADTVTALIWSDRGVDIARWRASEPTPETMGSLLHDEGGWNRIVDASGRWLVEIRKEYVLAIHDVVGSHTEVEMPQPLPGMRGTKAWSAAWHDTQPARLAWLACPRDELGSSSAIYVADVFGRAVATLPLPTVACEEPGTWLARWGEWGMLLHATEGSGTSQVLLNAEGTEIARGRLEPEGEWFVGVGPARSSVWTEGPQKDEASSFLLSADGLDRRPVPGLAAGERLESALASPDGSLLALVPDLVAHYGSEVRIVAADTGSVVAEIIQPSWWVTRMVWSTDSRFLIYERWPDVTANWAGVPQDVELVFYDTRTDTGVAFPLPGNASALRSAPPQR